jgi:hypothetical protein
MWPEVHDHRGPLALGASSSGGTPPQATELFIDIWPLTYDDEHRSLATQDLLGLWGTWLVVVRGLTAVCGLLKRDGGRASGGNMKTHEKIQGEDSSVILGGSRSWPTRSVADCEDRLHAVRSGLAGVAGALHVLAGEPSALSDDVRHRMESMLVAEVARLQRLVAPESREQRRQPLEMLDVDGVLSGVVHSRRMAGQEVAWSQTGHTVWGRHDDLVEVLNILLVNAWRHAGGAPARVQVTETGGRVTITVSDDGPGVPEHLRESIFERGVRRAASPGQGLGLAMARELVSDLDGTLVLAGDGLTGARFEITMAATVLHGAA